jgi:hypothetical protein
MVLDCPLRSRVNALNLFGIILLCSPAVVLVVLRAYTVITKLIMHLQKNVLPDCKLLSSDSIQLLKNLLLCSVLVYAQLTRCCSVNLGLVSLSLKATCLSIGE